MEICEWAEDVIVEADQLIEQAKGVAPIVDLHLELARGHLELALFTIADLRTARKKASQQASVGGARDEPKRKTTTH